MYNSQQYHLSTSSLQQVNLTIVDEVDNKPRLYCSVRSLSITCNNVVLNLGVSFFKVQSILTLINLEMVKKMNTQLK